MKAAEALHRLMWFFEGTWSQERRKIHTQLLGVARQVGLDADNLSGPFHQLGLHHPLLM